MAQLWLTYSELAEHLCCEEDHARTVAIQNEWTRKHSSDGNTRVLMPADRMDSYVITAAKRLASFEQHTTLVVSELRSALAKMDAAVKSAPGLAVVHRAF